VSRGSARDAFGAQGRRGRGRSRTAPGVGVVLGVLAVGAWGVFQAAGPRPGARAAAAAQTGDAVVAFVGVHVVPMDRERVLENQTVVVVGGRIRTVGPAGRVRVPAGAARVDAAGRYLMPGLAEMHAHIPPREVSDAQAERLFTLFLANGITTVRGMLGHPSHLALRDRVARGELLGPRIYTSGPSLNGRSVPDPDSARAAVRHQVAAGYDFLKLHPGLRRDVFDAIADEARRLGIPFAGHVSLEVGLARALEAGYASIDHLDGYVEALVPADAPVLASASQFFGLNLVAYADTSRIDAWARATAEAGVWNVPTMSLFTDFVSGAVEALRARPENRYVSPATLESWVNAVSNARRQAGGDPVLARRFLELRRAILRALHRAGAGLLLGSDAPQVFNVPGFSIHEELRELVAAGLTPYEALATGTRNVARFFGAEGEFGTVEPGRVADLVLLEGNPLEDVGRVGRPLGVMVRGRWLPRAELERRLERVAAEGGGA
jgi:imidazolonepropionase-like amidohydrolase